MYQKIYIYFFILSCLLNFSCKEIEPIPYIAFDADFNAPSIVRENDTIRFNPGRSTTGAKNYSWNFGVLDVVDDTSNFSSPTFKYTKFGKYKVKLKVNIDKSNGLVKDSMEKEMIVIPRTLKPDTTIAYGEVIFDESATDIVPLNDRSGYMVLGRRGINSLILAKLDNNFALMDSWPRQLDFITNQQVLGKDIVAAEDGGFAIVGNIVSSSTDNDAFVVKIDSSADVEWGDIINTSKDEYYNSVIQDFNGDFVIAGTTEDVAGRSIIIIDSYDNVGNKISNYQVPGCTSCLAQSMKETNDGGFVVVGVEVDNPIILKFFDASFLQTKRVITSIEGLATTVIPLSDGRFGVAGLTYTANTDSTNAFIAKVDLIGKSEVWVKRLSMYQESFVDLAEVVEDEQFKIVAVGTHFNPLSNLDILVAKYDSNNGDELAVRLYGDVRNNEASKVIFFNNDTEFIVLGATDNRFSPLQKRDAAALKLKIGL
jgi:hypothetical protein